MKTLAAPPRSFATARGLALYSPGRPERPPRDVRRIAATVEPRRALERSASRRASSSGLRGRGGAGFPRVAQARVAALGERSSPRSRERDGG